MPLVAMISLVIATLNGAATSFTNLHNFGFDTNGYGLTSGLQLSGNTLYGTTGSGGAGGVGTVFRINTDGTGFTNIHSFSGADGVEPRGRLVQSGDTLYGTTAFGGNFGAGTVFKINTDGTGFTNIYSFSGSDGATPSGGLTLSGATLYGTTFGEDATGGKGTVFRMNTDGAGFTNLYVFSGPDGQAPKGPLLLSGSTLYGTTIDGGPVFQGTVFRINIDGTAFTNLHSFDDTIEAGNSPSGSLVLIGQSLYGTTGGENEGTVFRIATDGTAFEYVHLFGGDGGSNPVGGLIFSESILYGTTYIGGINNQGTVFSLRPDGTMFTKLHDFSFADGINPMAGLISGGKTLYGTTTQSGDSGGGTVFALTVPPVPIPLDIHLVGGAVVLTWADNTFVLQRAPTVYGAYTNVPGAASPYANTVTDAGYFRLVAN